MLIKYYAANMSAISLAGVMNSIKAVVTTPLAALRWRRARRRFLRSCKERNSYVEPANMVPKDYTKLHIGANVRFDREAFLDTSGDITIGDATFFGFGVKILTGDHPIYNKGLDRQHVISIRPVFIGAGVFLGSYAIILPGSVIGDDSVVGAGSIVKGVFPGGTLIAGNPAKIVKSIDFGAGVKLHTDEVLTKLVR